MEPHKFTKEARGRPSLDLPCSTCGVIYREHEKAQQAPVVSTPVAPTTVPIAVELPKAPPIKPVALALKVLTRPPLNPVVANLLDTLVAANGDLPGPPSPSRVFKLLTKEKFDSGQATVVSEQ